MFIIQQSMGSKMNDPILPQIRASRGCPISLEVKRLHASFWLRSDRHDCLGLLTSVEESFQVETLFFGSGNIVWGSRQLMSRLGSFREGGGRGPGFRVVLIAPLLDVDALVCRCEDWISQYRHSFWRFPAAHRL